MRYTTLTLSGTYRETAPLVKSPARLAAGPEFRLDRFMAATTVIAGSRSIDTVFVVVKPDFRVQLFAGLEAIRRELLVLKKSGKKVLFFAHAFGGTEIYLSSAADERFIHPLGSLRFPGVRITGLYFGKALQELGVETFVARRGQFKSAPERFIRTDMSEPDRDQYTRFLDVIMKEISGTLTQSGVLTSADLEELLTGHIVSPEDAVRNGWATAIDTPASYQDRLKKEKKKARPVRVRSRRRRGARIAVLVFEGAIIDGRSQNSPLIGQALGSDTFIQYINRLKKDRKVAAVILRISSGGGSATASEDILRALEELAEKKPLVVSFGTVAASGGYWIACGAERIFSEATTLTGSIGAFAMSVNAQSLAERYGVFASGVKKGESADAGSAFRPLTEFERTQIDAEIERIYSAFISRVAAARGKSSEEIDAIGQGHVWAGRDAVENGLADATGGIREAAEYVREKLSLRRIRLDYYPRIKYSYFERMLYGNVGRGTTSIGPEILLAAAAGAMSREFEELSGKPLALAPEAIAAALDPSGFIRP